VRIDNRSLDRFVQALRKRNGCGGARGCADCQLRDTIAAALVQVADPAHLQAYGRATERLLSGVPGV
jgi:hypothetical protein